MPSTSQDRVRSVRLAVLTLVVLVVIGTAGFYYIGDHGNVLDSLWMTIQILTTVGDTGYERSPAERQWSLFLMAVGVLAVFYLGINVVAFVFDGELRKLLGRRKLESKIKKMKDHFIICGFGRMGGSLAEAFQKKGAPFVVIETDSDKLVWADEHGYAYINGNALSDEVLEMAQIGSARGLAGCLPDDSDNVFVALTARALNDKLTIVCKANYDETVPKLERAGADHVLSPPKLAADRAMTKFMLPAVDELMEIVVHGPEIEVSKVSLEKLPGAANRSLHDLGIPSRTGLMVVAVVTSRGERSFNPSPETVLNRGDELIVIGPDGGVERMLGAYGEPAEARG